MGEYDDMAWIFFLMEIATVGFFILVALLILGGVGFGIYKLCF